MKKNRLPYIKVLSSFCFILILAMSVFVFAFSSATASEIVLSNSKSFSIYFVAVAKSQIESEACTLAKDKIADNNAGYVWKNENYFYVINSAYENKNDAELVGLNLSQNNIKNDIFKVDFLSISIDSPLSSKEATSILSASLDAFLSCYRSLFDISVSLDNKVYDYTKTMFEINRVNAQTDEIMKNYNLIFSEIEIPSLESLSLALSKLNETTSHLSQIGEENNELISQIRYSYCEILEIYYDFLNIV